MKIKIGKDYEIMNTEEMKKNIKNGDYAVIFPKDRNDEKSAMELAELIDGVIAVASFVDREDKKKFTYGVIIELILLEDSLDIGEVDG